MEAVVRGTKTIEEFKRVREDMLKRAERYSRKHIASCENWQEGFPVKCWRGALALDRAAMIIASQNLGHNRESVVGEHYLRLSK